MNSAPKSSDNCDSKFTFSMGQPSRSATTFRNSFSKSVEAMESLPAGFQRAEYVQKTGFVDMIVNRKDLPDKIGTLLSILLKKNPAQDQASEEDDVSNESLTVKTKEAS